MRVEYIETRTMGVMGRVGIPNSICRILGFRQGKKVDFFISEDGAVVIKAHPDGGPEISNECALCGKNANHGYRIGEKMVCLLCVQTIREVKIDGKATE